MTVQTHYRYENARRNRVYGKPVPNTRVDTSELADRVSTIAFLEMLQLKCPPIFDRRLASATLFDPVLLVMKQRDPRNLAWYSIQRMGGRP